MEESDILRRQEIFIARQWELLEGCKNQRTQVPLIINGVTLGLTSFVLGNATMPSSTTEKYGIILVILLMMILGVYLLRQVEVHFNYFIEKIAYLYEKMGFTGEDFQPTTHADVNSALFRGRGIFRSMYVSIIVINLICAIGVLNLPIK